MQIIKTNLSFRSLPYSNYKDSYERYSKRGF